MKERFTDLVQQDSYLRDIYVIHQRISGGCFGQLYKVVRRDTGREAALKLQLKQKQENDQTLIRQHRIVSLLNGIQGIPKIYGFGQSNFFYYLEMELLVTDVSQLNRRQITLSETDICDMAARLIGILNKIHKRKVVHRDLKPQNIMVNEENQYYLVDFGISDVYKCKYIWSAKQLKKHQLVSSEQGLFIGTPRYASLTSHYGMPQSPVDDIESLIKKKLPWSNVPSTCEDRIRQIGKIKENVQKQVLCSGLPVCYLLTFQHLAKVRTPRQINYSYLISLFQKDRGATNIKTEVIQKNLLKIDYGKVAQSEPRGRTRKTSLEKNTDINHELLRDTSKQLPLSQCVFMVFQQPISAILLSSSGSILDQNMSQQGTLQTKILTLRHIQPKLKMTVDTKFQPK